LTKTKKDTVRKTERGRKREGEEERERGRESVLFHS
jgi:hypothetical protein